ncbi:MAG TPA: aminodeoxychorismate synthase component I [Opitutaceae bacterium]|nr:aminodeoxychorismate synthase component I [Opitutaceae bacterium]
MSSVVEKLYGLPAPAEVFRRIKPRRRSFFLDSGLAVGRLGAYSFLGFEPFLTVVARNGICRIEEEGRASEEVAGEPLETLRRLLQRYRAEADPRLPFTGGAVGYLSYEYGASWERVPLREGPAGHGAVVSVPDFEFSFYDGLLAFEHAAAQWHLVVNPVHRADAEQIRQRLLDAVQQEDSMAAQDPVTEVGEPKGGALPAPDADAAWYISAVRKIKEYIASGDVYQVNLAQRFRGEWRGDALALFSRLRAQTPAPFAAYLTTSFGHILSCSPERFIRLSDGKVETRPIKGTRRRGVSAEEDGRMAAELLASAKERAELLMIVDLERNDLGRVCRPGSIKVTQLYEIETHPTVLHLVGTIRGELREGLDAIDLLRATFPGGSITGAPKIRAMEIIRELERTPRDVYTGAIGFLGFDGACDFNIAIRTVVLRGTEASYHVGAGIVWDSDPESEYEETLIKGRALQAAFASQKGNT